MAGRRKSCPVSRRKLIQLDGFDVLDKSTYDDTETVRKLNKFDAKWFRENAVATTMTSKSFYGKTFVVPYKDVDGERFWIIDPKKVQRNKSLIEKYGDKAIL